MQLRCRYLPSYTPLLPPSGLSLSPVSTPSPFVGVDSRGMEQEGK